MTEFIARSKENLRSPDRLCDALEKWVLCAQFGKQREVTVPR